MAQFNVPQFNQMLFGGNVYTRTLTASPEIGLSTSTITRAATYIRTLTATAIALGVSIVFKFQNPRLTMNVHLASG
ncbi:hypothetical protein LCGC14_1662030 [marine sediment metagenome]|uniref:Uncharacterized protein n=1 Tax=marine sediment metagenome TaxID=412755 RepID=A0A0F9KTU8_9ZZZZ